MKVKQWMALAAMSVLIAACGGGSTTEESPADQQKRPAHRGYLTNTRAPKSLDDGRPSMPPTVTVQFFRAIERGCGAQDFVLEGGADSVVNQQIGVVKGTCDYLNDPYEVKWKRGPIQDMIPYQVYLSSTSLVSYSTADVKWFENDNPQGYGGLPYGIATCATGYVPSDQASFDAVNSYSAPFSLVALGCIYDPAVPDPEKDKGPPDHCPVGDPINQATGNNYQVETDFVASGYQVMLERTYNSQGGSQPGYFGAHWTSGFDRRIVVPDDLGGIAYAIRPHGERLTFATNDYKSWYGPSDRREGLRRLVDINGNVTGWRLILEDDSEEKYDSLGRITSARDRAGNSLTIAYSKGGRLTYAVDNFGKRIDFTLDTLGRIKKVTDPAQRTYIYSYDTIGNLTTVQYPGGKVIRHFYGEAEYTSGSYLPFALTGLKDEKGVRFANITYSAEGLATASEHAMHTERTRVTYTMDPVSGQIARAQVKFGDQKVPSTYTFSTHGNSRRATSVDRPCLANSKAKEIEWTYRGQVGYMKDFLGNEQYSYYDVKGNEYLREHHLIDGKVVSTTFEWDTNWRLPTKITHQNLTIKREYDPATGAVTKLTLLDTAKNVSRAWKYTPDSRGRVLEEDGPRDDVSDISKFSYYGANEAHPGQLKTYTNALGKVTEYLEYDAMGNLKKMKDPNGVVSSFEYDERDRVRVFSRGSETLQIDYDDVGQVAKISLPSGAAVTYTYDDARRLTDILMSDGSKIHYKVDSEGNVRMTDVYGADGSIVMTRSATYDDLRRVASITTARQLISNFERDDNGNLKTVRGPGRFWQDFGYDGFDRIAKVASGDTGSLSFDADPFDQIWRITDGNGKFSIHDLNLLGDLASQQLPAVDGTILQQVPDGAGNIKTKIDFRLIPEQRTYDALGRLKSRGAGSDSIAYTYDVGPYAVGRLAGMTDGSGTTTYSYDSDSQLAKISRNAGTLTIPVSFSQSAGLLRSVTYPSGRILSYGYVDGTLRSASIDGAPFVESVKHHPLGMVEGWTWANGDAYVRLRDADGLVRQYSLGAESQSLQYDNEYRLQSITDSGNSAFNQTFNHNLSGRVSGYEGPDSQGKPSSQSFTYDGAGNRKTHKVGSTIYQYSYNADYPNQLEVVPGPSPRAWLLVDSHTVTDGKNAFKLDEFGRVSGVNNALGATKYILNGLDQRVTKVSPSGATTHYVYGVWGELLAELDGSGNTLKEYYWLPTFDDGSLTLVGVAEGAGAANRVYTDHLGTPRLVTAPDRTVLWRWISDPFGGGAPQAPRFILNIRFQGQYYDSEHGYFYNWYRYYDPATGRYVQSDPVGPAGGVNTFEYVFSDPLSGTDPSGLMAFPWFPGGAMGGIPGIASPSEEITEKLAKALTKALRSDGDERRKKTYQTYTRFNPRTGQCYSGRTSGYGTPEDNIRLRGSQQDLLNREGFDPPILDKSSEEYDPIRGREQLMIERNGGARSEGGTSRNMINGISRSNLKGTYIYLPAARIQWGEPMPRSPGSGCTCN